MAKATFITNFDSEDIETIQNAVSTIPNTSSRNNKEDKKIIYISQEGKNEQS